MKLTIEQQLKEVLTKLVKYQAQCNREIFSSFFAFFVLRIVLVPEPKELKEEYGLIKWLMQYDKSALVLILKELGCDNNKTSKWPVLGGIGILPLLALMVFAAKFVYSTYSRLAIPSVGILSLAGVSMLILIFIEWHSYITKIKNEKCGYLIKEAIKLKEKNMSDQELQSFFAAAEYVMSIDRAEIKGPFQLIKEIFVKKKKK